MKHPWILWLCLAIALLVIGGFLWETIRPKDQVTHEIRTDTLRVTEWAIRDNWKLRVFTRDSIVYVPTPIVDSVLCCEQLTDCMDMNFSLANFEAEASQTLDDGTTARVSFSMPVYRESPEKAFGLLVTRPDTTEVRREFVTRERGVLDRIGVSFGIGYGIGPLGMGPSVQATLGYELFNLSDTWR